MYYSIYIETISNSKLGKKEMYEFDIESEEILITEFIQPYVNEEEFLFNGYSISKKDILRIMIKKSAQSIEKLTEDQTRIDAENMFFGFSSLESTFVDNKSVIDITKEIFKKITPKINKDNGNIKEELSNTSNKVFIVHGQDETLKVEIARFVEKLGLEAVILHEQANQGNTIIEKFERNTSEIGYAIILYTPCDKGCPSNDSENLKNRARQNVVFEHGYFIGKLGRSKVAAIVKGEIETPSDIAGVVYLSYSGNWKLDLAKEMKVAGLEVDMNKAL